MSSFACVSKSCLVRSSCKITLLTTYNLKRLDEQPALVGSESDPLGLYGQVNKRTRRMPWRQQAMKDVVACDKPRGASKQALIRGFPNGETHCL